MKVGSNRDTAAEPEQQRPIYDVGFRKSQILELLTLLDDDEKASLRQNLMANADRVLPVDSLFSGTDIWSSVVQDRNMTGRDNIIQSERFADKTR